MDNMLDISREAFPNPALARLSSVLHESESATQRGIDRAFPASLTGLAEHARRGHNAEDMLEHLEKGDYPHLTPSEVAPLIKDPVQTAKLAASGEGFLAQIFGSKLDYVVDMVAHQAGVSRTSAHVILGLSVPLLLDALSKESESRQLDAEGLSRFLSDQEEHAHSLLPGIVEGVVSATAARVEAGKDFAARPFFGGGPAVSSVARTNATYEGAPLSSAAYVSSGIPLSQVHGHTVRQAPTMDESVEEHFGESSRLARGLMWLIAALALITLISWGLVRLGPRLQTPPALPRNVGSSQPVQDRGAATSQPGGVDEAAAVVPSESASEAAISANPPATMRPSAATPAVPALPAGRTPNVTGGVSASNGATTSTGMPPLEGEAAVRALKKRPATGPRADALPSMNPPATDTGLATLGILQTKSAPSLDEAGRTDGIAETQRTNVPAAANGNAIPAYFAGGALPPKRFIMRELGFREGSAELPARSGVLDRTAQALREQHGATVLIEGYAEDTLSVARSNQLARDRAQAVKEYLMKHGVSESQLKTAGVAASERPAHGVGDRVELVVLSR